MTIYSMLSRRAFSRTAELGQLYDANNDLLLPGSIINFSELPKKIISENLTNSTNKNNSTAEKLKKKKFYEKVDEHKLSVNQAKKLLNNFA